MHLLEFIIFEITVYYCNLVLYCLNLDFTFLLVCYIFIATKTSLNAEQGCFLAVKRKVRMSVGKCSGKDSLMSNIFADHSDDRRRQFSNYSASSSMPGDLVAANRERNFNSLSNDLARVDNGLSRKHDRCPPLEVVSSPHDDSSFKFPQMPSGSSQPLSHHGMSLQKGANENVAMGSTFAESESTRRKMLTDARLEDANSSRLDCSSNWLKPCPTSPSGNNSLSSIPKEMRLKELLGLYKDTYPSGTLPDSLQLADVVEIIITVVVPESDNNFLWGQLASEPWASFIRAFYA